MRPDRQWMYNARSKNMEKYLIGIQEFLSFAKLHVDYMDGPNIRCPCTKCMLGRYIHPTTCESHLIKNGFMEMYHTWSAHGEQLQDCPEFRMPNVKRPSRAQPPRDVPNTVEAMVYDMANAFNDGHTEWQGSTSMDGDVHILSDRFWSALAAAQTPIWPGHPNESKLSATVKLLNLKAENSWSERAVDENLDFIHGLLPMENELPTSFYNMKRLVEDLGLPVQRIDTCRAGCMLFWKEEIDATKCKFCLRDRFKVRAGKKQPFQELFYLPLGPRLQRLYASRVTAEHMTWHAHHHVEEGIMCHPSDGDAWKNFNRRYPDFAREERNVRLGLCSDGFAPFGQFGRPYSCWPVILTPYNLPPGMCMKNPYMFISLIVPGPKSPKKNIDIYLQPLISELQMLWYEGVTTHDVNRDETFTMRAMLLWTISDFPAYGMLSGWSTHGVHSCPICMGNSRCFRLKHGKKPCYFDTHRQFLPPEHPYRMDTKAFTKDRVESMPPPTRMDGNEIWSTVSSFNYVVEDPIGTPSGFGSTHKWSKKSIFWTLPYWRHLLLRHNIDFMHVEKNVFENIINTVMNVKGRTKDNLNSRKDMFLICDRPHFSIDPTQGPSRSRKGLYSLNREDNQLLCDWLKGLRFPDGYASNLSRCVDSTGCKLVGLKSHDCHIFLQRLVPIAFKHLLPKIIWVSLTHLSNFMNDVSSSTLSVSRMQNLESDIVVILCNLEKIFPPSFFDSMEHLLIHLPYEAKIGGPVHYRWMYPFERFLQTVKKKVKNKARVEASICNAYILEEISTFASYYFESSIRSKIRSLPRNSEGPQDPKHPPVSIFNYPGRSSGASNSRYLDSNETLVAHTYVLLNCPEVDPYFAKSYELCEGLSVGEIAKGFAPWFRSKILEERLQNSQSSSANEMLYYLSYGPKTPATSFSLYYVNGYVWRPNDHLSNKATMNSGVCVLANDATYYGLVQEIIQLEYPGPCLDVVLFKCIWFDPVRGTRVENSLRVVDVHMKKKYTGNDPFILSQQGIQVCYAAYPSRTSKHADWIHVCRTKARGKIEERWTNFDVVYQNEIAIDGIFVDLQFHNDVLTHINNDDLNEEVDGSWIDYGDEENSPTTSEDDAQE